MNERNFRKTFCHMFFLKQSKCNEFFSFFQYIVTSAETETELLIIHFIGPKQDTEKKSFD